MISTEAFSGHLGPTLQTTIALQGAASQATLAPQKKKNLLAISFDEMEQAILERGWKRYRADQLLSWLYQGHVGSFDEMTDIAKSARLALAEWAEIRHLKIVMRQMSSDGTEKFLIELEDGNRVETVFIPGPMRLTLCISSQAGCTLDCGFCLTAQEKLKRNLKPHEMVGQILTLQRALPKGKRITNIVMMGMGEPLANYRNVIEALGQMTSTRGMGFSPRRVTVSTAGMIPQILKFWQEPNPVNLSISLNATTNAIRDEIMPAVNRLYPLEQLMAACRAVVLPPRRKMTFEYVLLAGVNDSLEDAKRLIQLTHRIPCKINLIPFNEFASSPYGRPSDDRVLQFQNCLQKGGLVATLRRSRGRDIGAACGQLNSEVTAHVDSALRTLPD